MTKHIKKVVVCKSVLLKATAPIKESFYQQTRGLLLLELERSSVVERQLDALLDCYVLYQRWGETVSNARQDWQKMAKTEQSLAILDQKFKRWHLAKNLILVKKQVKQYLIILVKWKKLLSPL